jgi:putative ABC transport system permease protein
VFLHDLRLAFLSLRRNPILTALMIGAIAAGIGAAMITITLYHARAGHPIWWKEHKLFAVSLDDRGTNHDFDKYQKHPEYPPPQLTYRDAIALYRSKLPEHALMMYRGPRVVDPGRRDMKPFLVTARITTADFFGMFDVPMLHGAGWSRAADEGPEPVVVIGRRLNDKLFAGANSVGRTIVLSSKEFRVIGVTDTWMPQPRYYDLNNGAFEIAEDLYMPFGWGTALQIPSWGNTNCETPDAKVGTFQDLLTQDCVWLQYWVQLSSGAQLQRFRQYVDNYTTGEKQHGRFPRPLNNRVVDVPTWLTMNDVIGDDSRLEVALAVMFLGVCILNTLGIMLAKFLGAAPITGLRRALGASRRDVMRQHLVEVITVGVLGGLVGLAFAWAGLWAIRVLTFVPSLDENPDRVVLAQSLSHLDLRMVGLAVLVSLITGALAGLYPAWRIGRQAPALFLKTQ